MTDTAEVDTPESTTEDQVKSVAERKADLLEARRSRLLGEEPEATEEAEEVEVETPDAEPEEPEVEEEAEVTDEDVPSQADEIDIESLSEDDIYAIAKAKGIELDEKGNTAWAAQRRKIKELEAELDAEKAAKQEALSIRNNNSAETQLNQVEANIKHWNRKLILEGDTEWDENTGRDVKGVTHDGKFYSAEQVLAFLEQEEGKLPDLRKKALEAEDARSKVGNLDEVIDGVRSKLNLEGDALDTYDKLLSNPKFEIVKNVVPEFGVELVELLGLAALQKAGPAQKKVTIKRKAPKETKANVSPTGGSGRPSQSGKTSEVKRLEKLVSDPNAPIKARREAQLKIRHLKYN